MQKNIIQKSAELAESNAELIASVASLQTEKVALTQQISDLQAKVTAHGLEMTQANEALATMQATQEASTAKIADLTAERDALASKVQTQAATMALTPQINQPAGAAPLAGGDAQESGEQPSTWPDAVKAAGGYVEARNKFPQLFESFVKTNKVQKPN